ncbi:calcium-binding protein [Mesorhizobium sp. DCY119]|uniref:calcium-binding protein n=1 Tax=Mesorhizobium sp. DCY119 TaxID=2108445 RepID=UPI000E71D76B|nr:calcium-binding protein [Mesorhizobium sp. DCY119]RJG40892.1 calcium-binding protein [Mesorhizobium sp. DCY119]
MAIPGTSGPDTLDGTPGNDEFYGYEGNDVMNGGSGDDTFYISGSSFGIDTFNGGDGADEIRLYGNVTVSQINFSSAKVSSVETLALGGWAFNGTTGNDTFNLSGIGVISSNRIMDLGDGDDTFTGHVGVNYVNGGSGNDHLDGGAGNDELTGAEGNDTLIGGTGDDTFYIAGSSFGIDSFNGGDGADEIRVNGNISVSQINFSSAKVSSVETLALGGYSFDGTIGNDTFNLSAIGAISSNRIMNLNDGDDNFIGHAGVNYVNGGSGNDRLDGGAGNDELTGAEGNDTLIGGTGDDTFYIAGSSFGIDTFSGGDGADTIRINGNISVSQIDFSAAKVSSVETLALGGYSFDGTIGNDRFNLSAIGAISSNRTMNLNDGNDVFIGHVGVNYVNGGSGNDSLDGGAGNDELSGGEGGDSVLGGTGDDDLYGNNGNDVINGGVGDDYMNGGAGNDIFYVNSTADRTIEAANQGTDTVQSSINWTLGDNVERLLLIGAGNLKGTGNALNNTIAGNAASNILNGAGGDDYMVGGAGNDIYYVSSTGDQTIEAAGGGTDTVRSYVNWTLAANVERLELLGAGNLNGVGNSLANTIAGTTGSNFINGAAGSDYLVGGAGNDTFFFNTALGTSNIDTIADYNVAQDTIRLENGIFTALVGTGTLTAAQFVKNASGTATDANDRIIYETDTGKLFYDSNGSAAGGQVQFAKLAAGLALTSSDFFIV